MRAGRLRHRVTIQEPIRIQDSDTGEMVTSWSTVWLDSNTPLQDIPAEVLTGPGREFIAAAAEQSEGTARINLRWFPGLQPSWRILWGDVIFGITSIELDATGRREYRLRCESGVNDGE